MHANAAPARLAGLRGAALVGADVAPVRSRCDVETHVTVTSPRKLDGFQLEEIACFEPSFVLTVAANSVGVRLPIELCGRLSL